MAVIGEIRKGKELGYKNERLKYIYVACGRCKRPRWVALLHGKPVSEICKACYLALPVRSSRIKEVAVKPKEEQRIERPFITPCKRCIDGQVLPEYSYKEGKVIYICKDCGAEHDRDNNLLEPINGEDINTREQEHWCPKGGYR